MQPERASSAREHRASKAKRKRGEAGSAKGTGIRVEEGGGVHSLAPRVLMRLLAESNQPDGAGAARGRRLLAASRSADKRALKRERRKMDEVAEEETRLFCKSIHLRRHPVEVRRPSPLSRPPHEHASSEARRETRRLSLRRLFFFSGATACACPTDGDLLLSRTN